MPSVLLRVKQEQREKDEAGIHQNPLETSFKSPDLPNVSDDKDISDDETEEDVNDIIDRSLSSKMSIVNRRENVKDLLDEINGLLNAEDPVEKEANTQTFKCGECGTDFKEREDAQIHIGEVHNVNDLLTELVKVFPGGQNNCLICDNEQTSDYERREHVLVHHPWPLLKALVDQAASENLVKPPNEQGKETLTSEDHTVSEELHAKEENNEIALRTWYFGKNNYSCKFSKHCKFSSLNRRTLKNHLEAAHFDMKVDKKRYSQHIANGRTKYECKICQKEVTHRRRSIREHLQNIHKLKIKVYTAKYETSRRANWDKTNMYQCKFTSNCKKSFANLNPAKKHLMKTHYNMKLEKRKYSQLISTEGKKYSCKICQTKLVHNHIHIKNHMKNQHQMNIDEYGAMYEPMSNEVQTEKTPLLLWPRRTQY